MLKHFVGIMAATSGAADCWIGQIVADGSATMSLDLLESRQRASVAYLSQQESHTVVVGQAVPAVSSQMAFDSDTRGEANVYPRLRSVERAPASGAPLLVMTVEPSRHAR